MYRRNKIYTLIFQFPLNVKPVIWTVQRGPEAHPHVCHDQHQPLQGLFRGAGASNTGDADFLSPVALEIQLFLTNTISVSKSSLYIKASNLRNQALYRKSYEIQNAYSSFVTSCMLQYLPEISSSL